MTVYKGRVGQWSWIFHRVTGVGVLLFLFAHIIDTLLVGFGPEVYNKVIAIYRHPFWAPVAWVMLGHL
jgi:succinate dehydrogenase / fumarate reductase cytochrome b subunit